ncbi:hypothetical protein AB0392_19185 [Nonomuraea angiospora]|uniref:hypothetical protein n=1 Tax=Nonomuraea angiospora TaxID=46172 RepID=UPI00344F09AE
MERWHGAAAATWNRHLSAPASFTAWAQRQDLLATNPARRLSRPEPAHRGDRAIPAARLERLFTDNRHPLRERLLHETAARAEEMLSLDVEDLDTEFRRARVISKGGAIEDVHRATATARLLPRPLEGRQAGPVWCSWPTGAPSLQGHAGPRLPTSARLPTVAGCPTRAEYPFKTASAPLTTSARVFAATACLRRRPGSSVLESSRHPAARRTSTTSRTRAR